MGYHIATRVPSSGGFVEGGVPDDFNDELWHELGERSSNYGRR